MKIGTRLDEKKSTFRERLTEAMSLRKMTQADLARATGLNKGGISNYVTGRYEPKSEIITKLASALDCSEMWLRGFDVPMRRKQTPMVVYDKQTSSYSELDNPTRLKIDAYLDTYTTDQLEAELVRHQIIDKISSDIARPIKHRSLPMLGNVACGEPIFAEEDRDSYISVDDDMDADFCLTAIGDSMINARIFDGDILFVKKCDIVDDGQIAVVLIEDEATVKRLYYDRENNVITLVPENPTHKPMRFMGEQLNQIRVLGKVVSGQYKVL